MIAETGIVAELKAAGVRFYGRVIVSPFSTKDSAGKCQLINFLVERCGYRLGDDRAYTAPKSQTVVLD